MQANRNDDRKDYHSHGRLAETGGRSVPCLSEDICENETSPGMAVDCDHALTPPAFLQVSFPSDSIIPVDDDFLDDDLVVDDGSFQNLEENSLTANSFFVSSCDCRFDSSSIGTIEGGCFFCECSVCMDDEDKGEPGFVLGANEPSLSLSSNLRSASVVSEDENEAELRDTKTGPSPQLSFGSRDDINTPLLPQDESPAKTATVSQHESGRNVTPVPERREQLNFPDDLLSNHLSSPIATLPFKKLSDAVTATSPKRDGSPTRTIEMERRPNITGVPMAASALLQAASFEIKKPSGSFEDYPCTLQGLNQLAAAVRCDPVHSLGTVPPYTPKAQHARRQSLPNHNGSSSFRFMGLCLPTTRFLSSPPRIQEHVLPADVPKEEVPLPVHSSEGVLIYRVGKNDFLLGKGARVTRHFGNRRVRQVIHQLLPLYKSSKPEKKRMLVDRVFRNVRAHGGHFIRSLGKGSVWECISEAEAKTKIAQRFREEVSGRPKKEEQKRLIRDR